MFKGVCHDWVTDDSVLCMRVLYLDYGYKLVFVINDGTHRYEFQVFL